MIYDGSLCATEIVTRKFLGRTYISIMPVRPHTYLFFLKIQQGLTARRHSRRKTARTNRAFANWQNCRFF